jgi:hypothetical protein
MEGRRVIPVCETLSLSGVGWFLVIQKGPFGPLFFSNQQRGGRECKCAIHTALSTLQLSGAFVFAHVVSPGRGSVPYVKVL